MNKLEVGDEVIFLGRKASEDIGGVFEIGNGDIGTIQDIDSDGDYWVLFPNAETSWCFDGFNLEKVLDNL